MRAISDEARLFDHVLVETSGLAVPTAVLAALHGPALQERFIHDATLTIVDTPLLLAGVYDAGGHSIAPPLVLQPRRCFSSSSCVLTSWS